VICGYLDADLKSVADDILLAGADPIEIHARDMRAEPEEPVAVQQALEAGEEPPLEDPDGDDDGHPAVNATERAPDGPGTAADPRSAAWKVASLPGPRTCRDAAPPRAEERVEVVEPEDLTIADVPLPAADPAPRAAAADEGESTVEWSIDDEPTQQELDAGVTSSADWEHDDDPASYSAPI
jgi:hypothetical protein